MEDVQEQEQSATPEQPNVMQLGGSIELAGFREVDRSSMIVLKKIIGSYARKFSDHLGGIEQLKVSMKTVHETEGSQKFEVKANLHENGKVHGAEVTERNLFVTVDKVLQKITNAIGAK